MAYYNQRKPSYYRSWDKKTEIVQEYRMADGHTVSSFSITNKTADISIKTKWYSYPFKDNHTISDLLLVLVPAFKENRNLLPLVETTSHHYSHDLLCGTYVLKDKTKIRMYLPVTELVRQYKAFRERPTKFQLSDGMHVREVSPDDIVEILEE